MTEKNRDPYKTTDAALAAACRYPESYTESMPEEFDLTVSIRILLDAPKPPFDGGPNRFSDVEYAREREERARALHIRLSDLLKAFRREIEAHAGHVLEIEPKTDSRLLKLMFARQLTNGAPDQDNTGDDER